MTEYLEKTGETFRFLAFSDTRDLVFQGNPFEWLESNLPENKSIAVIEEGIDHKDPWNRRNVIKTYGHHALKRVINTPVCCAGFFAGRTSAMLDFMLALYYFDQTKRSGDQAAFNQLLTFSGWRDQVQKWDWTSQWAVHACTVLRPISNPGSFADPKSLPLFKKGVVTTANGEPYAVVHQYDREPEWKAYFEKAFGSVS